MFHGLAPNISWPPGAPQCSIATDTGDLNAPQPTMPVMRMIPLNIPESPMPIASTLLPPMVGPPMGPPVSIPIPTVPVPPPPGSQFTPLPAARPFVPTHMPLPAMLPMVPQPPSPQGIPPPPPEEAPPPLPEESKPKRKRVDDTSLIPEDQLLAHHPGSVHISISVPKVDEGNLKGQTLEISVQSLTETIGSVKEKTCRRSSTSGEQTETECSFWFSQGQHVACLLQHWPRRNTNSKRTWWQEAINGTLLYSDWSSLDWKSSSLI